MPRRTGGIMRQIEKIDVLRLTIQSLNKGIFNVQILRAKTGLSPSFVASMLSKLKDRGEIRRIETGRPRPKNYRGASPKDWVEIKVNLTSYNSYKDKLDEILPPSKRKVDLEGWRKAFPIYFMPAPPVPKKLVQTYKGVM
jgi:hypothetical protein